jgi:hypothetical protein
VPVPATPSVRTAIQMFIRKGSSSRPSRRDIDFRKTYAFDSSGVVQNGNSPKLMLSGRGIFARFMYSRGLMASWPDQTVDPMRRRGGGRHVDEPSSA